MMRNFLCYFNNLSIRYKLFISYLILIAVPFCLFIIINFYISSKDTEMQAMLSSRKILTQVQSSLQYKTEYIKNLIDMFSQNDTINELIYRNSDYYRDNIGNWWVDSKKYTSLLFSLRSNPDITTVQLYMKDGLAAMNETDEFLSLNKAKETDWYKKMIHDGEIFQWFPSEYFPQGKNKKCVSLLKLIPSNQDLNVFSGIIKVDIPEAVFKNVLDQSEVTKGTSTVLINKRNEIISSSSNYNINKFIISDLSTTTYSDDIPQSGMWYSKKLENASMLIGVQTIHATDWRLFLIVPYRDILAQSVKSRNQMLFVLLIFILFTFPLSFLVNSPQL